MRILTATRRKKRPANNAPRWAPPSRAHPGTPWPRTPCGRRSARTRSTTSTFRWRRKRAPTSSWRSTASRRCRCCVAFVKSWASRWKGLMKLRSQLTGGMGVGRGPSTPLDFENYSKKGCFLNFDCEKNNFTTFGPPWILDKSHRGPPRRNPSDAHAWGVRCQAKSPTSRQLRMRRVTFQVMHFATGGCSLRYQLCWELMIGGLLKYFYRVDQVIGCQRSKG